MILYVSKVLSFFLCADDTNIYYESVNITKLRNKLVKELVKVNSWLEINKLALNIAKTNFVVFHSSRKKLLDDIQIRFGKKSMARASYVKFLGFLMDEHLAWKFHISELTKKLSTTTGVFFKIRQYFPLDILKNLYYSIFSSFLSYGSSTWGLLYDTYIAPLSYCRRKYSGLSLFSLSSLPLLQSSIP